MSKPMRVFHMNEVCGVNKTTLKVGEATAVTGLILATVGFALTALTIGKFTPGECEVAHEFVDAILS